MRDREPCLRTVLMVVVLVDLVWLFFLLGEARGIGLDTGALNPFDDWLSRIGVRGAVVLIGVAGALTFGRGPGRLWAGALALSALVLLNTAHAQLFGSPWRHLFFSGLCLAGWLLGLAVSRWRGTPGDESFARTGSLAFLAAAYLNAGISKIVYGGVDWLSGLPIQATIVAQDGLVPHGLLSPYRVWIVDAPWAAAAFSVATMAFELGAPLMLAGRRIRAGVALGLFAMHANIYLLTAILYAESMVLLLAFGLLPDAPPGVGTGEGSRASRSFAVGVVVLGLFAVVAVAHQYRRYVGAETVSAAPSTPSPSAIPTTLGATAVPSSIRTAGPFSIGQVLADGWSVDVLEPTDAGIVVRLGGRPGRVSFEITCAVSPYQSPFDLGPLHVFYSSDLLFDHLNPAGRAVQEAIRQSVARADACQRLAEWRAELPPPAGH